MSGHLSLAEQVLRATRAVLVVDVAESVRLIEEDEEGVVRRWIAFVHTIEDEILPERGGRLVKSLGDGMLLEFADARAAAAAALDIQRLNSAQNAGQTPDRCILLRIGIEVSDIIIERDDVFGRGVNRAARLSALAGPSEIVISESTRDCLTSGVDADIEDLGECYVRNLDAPIRAYRVGPPGPRPIIRPGWRSGDLLPLVAVIPFSSRNVATDHGAVGEVIAEELIRALAHSPRLHVISRLSTTAFRGRDIPGQQIGTHLGANYVLFGSYQIEDGNIRLEAQLEEVRSGRLVWTERIADRLGSLTQTGGGPVDAIAARIYSAVVSRELQRARSQPFPTLESYALIVAAVSLMHRLSGPAFEEARQMLQTVAERTSHHAIPYAWMAKWHQLRLQQGWCQDPDAEASRALDCTKRALDADPECSLALAIDGIIETQLRRYDVALDRYQRAIEANPNDSLAWLLKGTTHAFMGEGATAVADTERARALSPLDPHGYLYDCLSAAAHIANHDYETGLELAQRSLRANRHHASTLRALAVAQWQLGLHADARSSVEDLLGLEPDLTIRRYLHRSPAAPFPTGHEWARALRAAGVPN